MNLFSVACPACGRLVGQHCLTRDGDVFERSHKGRHDCYDTYRAGVMAGKRQMKNSVLAIIGAAEVSLIGEQL